MLGVPLGRRPLGAPIARVNQAALNTGPGQLASVTATLATGVTVTGSLSKTFDPVLPPAAIVLRRGPQGSRPLGSPDLTFAPSSGFFSQNTANASVSAAGANTGSITVNATLAQVAASSAGAAAEMANVWATLTEPGTTNLLINTTTFSSHAIALASLTPAAATAPDGSVAAQLFADSNTTTGQRALWQTATVVSGSTYTYSIYMKAGLYTTASLFLLNSTFNSGCSINVDLSAGTLSSPATQGTGSYITSTITNAGSGWYRVTITGTIGAFTSANAVVYLQNSTSYAGTVGKGVYVWGPQLELGPVATPYIASGATPSTRVAHGLRLHNPNLIPTSNDLSVTNSTNNTSITANATTGPDGNNTATLVTSTGAGYWKGKLLTSALLPNVTYTASVWVKLASGSGRFRLSSYDGSASAATADQVATSTWQRFTQTFTTSAGATTGGTFVLFAPLTGYVAGDAFYTWGWQLEIGSSATDYFNNTGSTTGSSLADAAQTISAFATPTLTQKGGSNLSLYSQDFTQWSMSNGTMVLYAQAPDGSFTAADCSNAVNLGSFARTNATQPVLATSTYYTMSIYAKAGTGTNDLILQPGDGNGWLPVHFDVSAGTIGSTAPGATAAIQSMGGGWYRCSVTFLTSTTAGASAYVYYIGGYGTTSTPTTIRLWGAQIEQSSAGALPGPYVPTQAVARTTLPHGLRLHNPNLLIQSNGFSSIYWSVTGSNTLTANYAAGPDGGATSASRLQVGTASSGLRQYNTSIPGVYTMSIWVMSNTGSNQSFVLRAFDNSNAFVSGSMTATTSWQRFSYTFTATGSGGNFQFDIQGAVGGDLLIFGAQWEQGSTATDYYPTGTATYGSLSADIGETVTANLISSNMIPNGDAVGGSGATAPTGWTLEQPFGGLSPSGWTSVTNSLGRGAAQFTISGTTTATNRLLISPTYTSSVPSLGGAAFFGLYGMAAAGVPMTFSFDFRVVSGTYAYGIQTTYLWYDATGALLSATFGQAVNTAPSVATRYSDTMTPPANAYSLRVRFDFVNYGTSGTAVNFTLELGGLQLEYGSVATDYLKTTGTAGGYRLGDPPRQNICTLQTANPVSTTGIVDPLSTAGYTISIVDDSAELALAGLNNICTSGKVYKIDGTGASTSANFDLAGTTTASSSTLLTSSAYIRGSGTHQWRISTNGDVGHAIPAHYTRFAYTNVPTASPTAIRVLLSPGSIIYFILPQLEIGAAATAPIVDDGASVSRTNTGVTPYVRAQGFDRTANLFGFTSQPAATNLTGYSEDFTQWAPGSATVTKNVDVAPNGTTTANSWIEDNTNVGNQRNVYIQAATPSLGVPYTASIYVKAKLGSANRRIAFSGAGFLAQGFNIIFDPSSGTFPVNVGGAGTAAFMGNGWWRVSATFSPSTASSLQWFLCDSTNSNTYGGDGASGLLIWGGQWETGSQATGYIPTYTSSTAARSGSTLTSLVSAAAATIGAALTKTLMLAKTIRTNLIQNSSMVGAVTGSPGTLPSRWGISYDGGLGTVTRTVVGTGISTSNLPYIDLRFQFTTAVGGVGFILPVDGGATGLLPGKFAFQYWATLTAGSGTNVVLLANTPTWDASNNLVGDYYETSSIPLTSTRTQVGGVSTAGDATSYGTPRVRLSVNAAGTYDFTMRIEVGNLEQGDQLTTPIITNNTGVLSASNFTGTIAIEANSQTQFTETAATNQAASPNMQGASSSTIPTGWSYNIGATGIAIDPVGTGVEFGMNYVDLRIHGTCTAFSYSSQMILSGLATAAQGDKFSFSIYARKIADVGSTAFSALGCFFNEQIGGSYLTTTGQTSAVLTSSLTRISNVATVTSPTANNVELLIELKGPATSADVGKTYDATIRLYGPMLQKTSQVNAFNPTATVAHGLSFNRTNLISNSMFSGGTIGNGNYPSLWQVCGAQGTAETLKTAEYVNNVLTQVVSYRRVGATGFEGIQQAAQITYAGVPYTVSVWVRRPTGLTATDISFYNGSGNWGIASAAQLNAQAADTWVQYSFTFTPSAGSAYIAFISSNPTGTGTGWDIAMPQLEIGSAATAFIPTTSGPVTTTDAKGSALVSNGLTVMLAAATLASAVSATATASLSRGLATAIAASTGAVSVALSVAQTLGTVTKTMTGSIAVAGTLTKTTGAATLSSVARQVRRFVTFLYQSLH